MKKLYRIKKNEEFSRIISKKHSISNASFVLYYTDRALDNARAGLSVSKKLGDAVERNKIKRQVRSMLDSLIDYETYSKDIIVIVRKPYLDKAYNTNLVDLEKLVKKAII